MLQDLNQVRPTSDPVDSLLRREGDVVLAQLRLADVVDLVPGAQRASQHVPPSASGRGGRRLQVGQSTVDGDIPGVSGNRRVVALRELGDRVPRCAGK